MICDGAVKQDDRGVHSRLGTESWRKASLYAAGRIVDTLPPLVSRSKLAAGLREN
jgi:hypothetical protein